VATFSLDNDVPMRMAALLRAAGHHVVTARELGMTGADDDVVLLAAADRASAVISHNVKDFTLLHGAWLRWTARWSVDARHGGILLLPQPTAAERLRDAMNAVELTRLVLALVAQGSPRPNELWQWQRGRGWVLQRP
jgi:hypothetical protein